jgi:hypothetical protein
MKIDEETRAASYVYRQADRLHWVFRQRQSDEHAHQHNGSDD